MVKPSQILCLIDTSLTLLEKGELDQAYAENLINFISRNYGEISVDLIGLLKQHEEYLKLNRLLDRIGEGKLRLLFAPEDFKEEDLERFSSSIKSSHKGIFKASVLLEFSSNVNYESKVGDFARESFANGEKVYIFTRMESRVDLALRGLGVNYVFLSTLSSSIHKVGEKTKIIQITDISQILGAIMLIKNTNESSSIVFDSLTDLMLLTNFEQAYKASRHALDIIANSSIHALFLIEKDAHDKSKMSAFENLFRFVIK